MMVSSLLVLMIMNKKTLKKCCDEVFGADNFISEFVWKSRQNKDNRNITGVSIDHEYIVCYQRTFGMRALKRREKTKNRAVY